MKCNCNLEHKVNGMSYTADTSLVLSTTNSTNINSLDNYNFFFPCSQNPSSVVTGSPVQVYLTINGVSYPLQNMYGLPVYSNYLKRRKMYEANYVNNGTTGWVRFKYLPKCKAHA